MKESNSSQTSPRCFVINLPEASARRTHISQEFSRLNLAFEFIEGVNGKKLSHEELQRVYDHRKSMKKGRGLALGEIGVSLTHQNIYRKMLCENIDHAFIFEDDVILNSNLLEIMKNIQQRYDQDNPMLILLTYVPKYLKPRSEILLPGYNLVAPYGSCRHTSGYFITRAAAKKLTNYLYPLWLVSDPWLEIQRDKIIPIKAVVPCCVHLHELSETPLVAQRGPEVYPKKNFLYRHGNIEIFSYLYKRLKKGLHSFKAKLLDEIAVQPSENEWKRS